MLTGIRDNGSTFICESGHPLYYVYYSGHNGWTMQEMEVIFHKNERIMKHIRTVFRVNQHNPF